MLTKLKRFCREEGGMSKMPSIVTWWDVAGILAALLCSGIAVLYYALDRGGEEN